MRNRIFFSVGLIGTFVLGLLAFHPIARAYEAFGAAKCASTQPCAGGNNTSTGQGAIGYSTGGTGFIGQTLSTSTSTASYGVWGRDKAASGNLNAGLYGTSPRGTGTLGQSQQGIALYGLLTGPIKSKPPFTPAGLEGVDNTGVSSATAVIGVSKNNDGIYGQTNSSSGNTSALVLSAPNGASLIYATSNSTGPTTANGMVLDTNGNISISGEIYTSGSACNSGCVKHQGVREAAIFAASPTIEDAGEAHMVLGGAYVPLDPKFANVIDQRQGYVVLITPEGDTRGLYVARRTPSGFAVRETMGGRSTLDFAYRIVAHPAGAPTERLPSFNPFAHRAAPVIAPAAPAQQ